MAAASSPMVATADTSSTASTVAGAATIAAPTIATDTPTPTCTAAATITAATITTTIPVTTTAVDIMDTPTADGARQSPGAGAGAVIPGTDIMDTISIPTRSTQRPLSGSLTM